MAPRRFTASGDIVPIKHAEPNLHRRTDTTYLGLYSRAYGNKFEVTRLTHKGARGIHASAAVTFYVAVSYSPQFTQAHVQDLRSAMMAVLLFGLLCLRHSDDIVSHTHGMSLESDAAVFQNDALKDVEN